MYFRTQKPMLPPYCDADLSDEYRRLEGLTQLPQRPWTDAIATIGVVLGLLFVSSVTLGMAAHQATTVTTALANYLLEDSLDTVKTPSSWRF